MGSTPHAAAARGARRVRRLAAGLGLTLAALAAAAEDEVPAVLRQLGSADAAERGAAKTALLARADADQTVVEWLRDGSKRARLSERAATALVEIVGERGLQLANSGLRAVLRDTAAPVEERRAAANALAKTGTIADVAALGEAMGELPAEAARALAAIGGGAATGVLRDAMKERPTLDAAAALAKLGDGGRLEDLVTALGDPAQRARAAELLAWATGRALGDDPAAWKAFVARRGLAIAFAGRDVDAAQALVETTAASARDSAAVAADLAAIVADPSFPVFGRSKAALALGLSGSRAHNDVLLASTANGQPGELRWAAANALGRVGDLSCAAKFASMLVHDEDRDRIAAKRTGPRQEFVPVDGEMVRALFRRGVPGAAQAAIDLLDHELRTGLHREALFAIQELSGGDDFGFQPDASKAERVVALERIKAWWFDARETAPVGGPAADDPGWAAFRADVDALVTQLGAFKFLHNMRAKAALVLLAEPAAPQLEKALAHEQLHVRNGAADVMARTGLRRFGLPLATRLGTETNSVAKTRQLAALETCGRKGKDGAWPAGVDTIRVAVRACLQDKLLDVRIAAARALGVVGDASDAERIRKSRADEEKLAAPEKPDEVFLLDSAGALLLLGDRSAMADLIRGLRSEDAVLRTDAADFLRRGGVDLRSFRADGTAEEREAAVRGIEKDVSSGERR